MLTSSNSARLAQTDVAILQLELYMVSLVNYERQLMNVPVLRNHGLLASVARAHSDEMRALKYFEHESPTPHLRTIMDRYSQAFGSSPRYLAENIAYATLSAWIGRDDPLEKMVRGWINQPLKPKREDVERSHRGLMNSPGHRANILSPKPVSIGIGIVHAEGEMWVTQMFARST